MAKCLRWAFFGCLPDRTVDTVRPEVSSAARQRLDVRAREVLEAHELTGFHPLTGGASRELFSFDAITGDGESIPLVLLRDRKHRDDSVHSTHEWHALRAAFSAGVPVAEPLWHDRDGADIVMRRLPGETIPRRVLRDERVQHNGVDLLGKIARAAAAIHHIPPTALPTFSLPSEPAGAVALRVLEEELDRHGEPHPALEVGLRWLRQRIPPPRPPRLVHGDFRLGNFLVASGELVAVLDWELAHLGDPAEDLGWLCVRSWRFGRTRFPAAGLGGRMQLIERYVAAGGVHVGVEELRFWETLGNLRWGVFCVRQAQLHLAGSRISLELAAIGRRTCEAEWDMLAMIS